MIIWCAGPESGFRSRGGAARRLLAFVALWVAAFAWAASARGKLVVEAPDRPDLECNVTFFDSLTRDIIRAGPAEFRRISVTYSEFSVEEPVHEARVVLRDRKTGDVAITRVKFDERGDGRGKLSEDDFFAPKTLELVLVSSGLLSEDAERKRSEAAITYQVEAASSDGHVYAERVTNVELERVRFDTLRGGQTKVTVTAHEEIVFERSVEIPDHYTTLRLPVLLDIPFEESYSPSGLLFTTSSEPEGSVFLGVSVLLFILATVLWVASGLIIGAMPHVFDIDRRSHMRKAAVPTLAVCGLILVGNGVGLLVLGEGEYLAVVASICCVQLALLFWLILAVQGRSSFLISVATLGVIAGLCASILFVPALAVQRESDGVAIVLSLIQIALVLVAITVLAITRIRERLLEEPRAVPSAGRVCPYCGQRPNPITGLCACAPKGVNIAKKPTASLTIKSTEGAMAQVLIGSSATIGRDPTSDVVLADDVAVSRNHAAVFTRGDDLVLRDVGSANGTFVNGEKIAERVLHDGDTVQIGESWLLFERIR